MYLLHVRDRLGGGNILQTPERYESIVILPRVGDEVDDMVCPNTIRLTEAVSSKWTIKRCLADFTWIGVGREPPDVLPIKRYGN